MAISTNIRFLRRWILEPNVIGALAPSSRRLALAMCRPFAERTQPARVLEVGAGTGPVTRVLGELLGPEDRLDVCELQADLAEILEKNVLAAEPLASAVADGRVRMFRGSVEQIIAPSTYDYIIAGLPFTSFQPHDVERIIGLIQRNLKPGGTFTYFEYVALRQMTCTFYLGAGRKRARATSQFMESNITKYQVDKRYVPRNFLPALVHDWKFTKAE